MLVIEQMNDARRPLTTRNDIGIGAEKAEKTEGGGLFHNIHGLSGHINMNVKNTSRIGSYFSPLNPTYTRCGS